MANTPNDLDEDLRKELECPVCFEFMKPPISMCENGHNICSACKPKLNKCPSCRRPFLQVRNRALESLSAMFVNTNSNPKNSQSAAKIYKCPFSTISREDCVWDGSLYDMRNHIKNSHTYRNDTDRSNRRFNVVLADLSPERHYRSAVWVGDELFYVVWEIKDGSFFCAVLYVGPTKKSRKFIYKFSLTSENGMKNISMLFQTPSVVRNMENVFTPGECVLLHYDTVMKFLNSEKCLHCAFEISPIETLSGGDRNLSQHGASSDFSCGADFFTDERDLLEQEVKRELLAAYDNMTDGSHPHHSDVYRNGRGGKQGRGGGRGRFNRAGRRGGERAMETQANCESGVRNLRHRSRSVGRYSNLGRSLTDLHDQALYEGEDNDTLTVGQLRDIAHAKRIIVNASSSSSAVKFEKTDKPTSVSGLGNSQGKAKANKHKVNPSGLPTAKYASRENLTKVSAVGKSQGNFQESVPTVISFPSLSSVKYAPSQPAPTQERTEVKSQMNDSKAKSPSSEQLTDGKVLGESKGIFQGSGPVVKLSGLRTVPRVNLTNVPSLSKPHYEAVVIDPKCHSVTVEDHQSTAVPPVDASHGFMSWAPSQPAPTQERTGVKSQMNDSKVKSPSSEQVTDGKVLGESKGIFQGSGPVVKLSGLRTVPSVNLTTVSKVKSPSSEQVTDGKVLGESHGNFQASGPALKSVGLPPTSSVRLTKSHDKAEAIYPKLDFVDVDDHQSTAVSPFDTLHDIVQARVSRGNAPTNLSTVSNIPSQQSTNVSPGMSVRNNPPHKVTASEETWKCSLCGYLAPVKRTNQYFPFVDIAPPGTNWKCKLCDQWRP